VNGQLEAAVLSAAVCLDDGDNSCLPGFARLFFGWKQPVVQYCQWQQRVGRLLFNNQGG